MEFTPIERIKAALFRLFHGTPAGEPVECMYGRLLGASENCTVTVPPYGGYRDGRYVFCSEEHAQADFEDRL